MESKKVIIGIYKITSPSNRIYIGESLDVNKRLLHYSALKNCKSQTKLYRSFIKHGVKNHVFEIIEECEIENLYCRERYWQDHYDVLNGGLNCRLSNCEDVKGVMSYETRQKLSNAQKQLRIEGKGNPPPPPMIGSNNPMFNKNTQRKQLQK
jgi:group I intron endonuclease